MIEKEQTLKAPNVVHNWWQAFIIALPLGLGYHRDDFTICKASIRTIDG